MVHGVETDPVTGLPVEKLAKTASALKAAEKSALLDQAKFADVAESSAGRQLQELIALKLEARVAAVLKTDPEATVYLEILKTMKSKIDMARRATSKLVTYGHL